MKKWLLFLAVSASTQLWAQWNGDPTVNNPVVLATATPATKSGLVGTTDLLGNAYFAWIETRTSSADIFIQKMNANGTIAFTSEGITVSNAGGSESNIDMVPDLQGGVILVWQDNRAGNNDIYAQRVSPLGTLLWAGPGVAICNTAESQTGPKITLLNSTEFAVVWRDNRLLDGTTNNGIDIYANKFSVATGTKILANDVVVVSEANNQTSQVVFPDGQDGFISVWADPRASTSNLTIYGQRFNNSFTKLWGSDNPNNGLQISSSGAFTNVFPSIVTDGANGIGVAWQSTRPPATASTADIYFQRITAAGAKLDNDVLVCNAANQQTDPIITWTGAAFAMGWYDNRNQATTGVGRDFYAQSVSTTGIPLWNLGSPGSGVAIAENLTGSQPISAHYLIPDGTGGVVFVWDDARNGNTNTDVMAQRVSGAGSVLWAANGAPVATRTGSNQTAPVVGPFSTGSSIIVGWRDNRNNGGGSNATNEIYASQLLLDGTLPVTLLEFGAAPQGSQILTSWKTADERQIREFVVQKSADANHWVTLGKVKARNTHGTHQYSFTDVQPINGDNFYRLQQVDADGSLELSRVVKVNMARKQPALITVYPNPAADLVKITLSNLPAGNYQLRLFDNRGAVLQSRTITAGQNLVQTDWQLRNLPAGRYWLQVLDGYGKPVQTAPVQKQ